MIRKRLAFALAVPLLVVSLAGMTLHRRRKVRRRWPPQKTTEAWSRAQCRDRAVEFAGAKVKLLAKLETCSENQQQSLGAVDILEELERER
jgi:hypothetical protein